MPEAIPLTSTLPIVDGVTDLNGATLNQLEIAAKKGAANGYAPLDATSKVPLANLPAVSGVDYIGPWAAGTAFKRGDVVKYLGNDYLAVNDSTGVVPPAPVVPPLLGASYGTSLPASPFDGQEAILVDSLTNPTYQWRFRWNAGSSSAYKWEFIGGALAASYVGASESTSSATDVDLATVGPQLTIPRSGDYIIGAGYQCSSGSVTQYLVSNLYKNNVNMAFSTACSVGAGAYSDTERRYPVGAMAAGDVIKLKYHTQAASLGSFQNRLLSVQPQRVA